MGKLLSIVIQAIIFAFSCFLLIFLLVSFPDHLENVPIQPRSRWTGYSSWDGGLQDFDPQSQDTIYAFSITWIGITSLLAIYWTYWYKQPENTISYFKKGIKLTPTTLFNQMLAILCIFTTFTMISSLVFGFGKLFSVGGMMHNFTEVLILLLIGMGGRVRNNYYFFIAGIYSVVIYVTVLGLSWPYDFLLFKAQELILDSIFPIIWMRGIISTYRNYNEEEPDREMLLNEPITSDGTDGIQIESLFPTSIHHPRQLWLLFFASVIHVAGNLTVTIGYQSAISEYVMLLTYGITFPLFAFYIYLDTHANGNSMIKYYYFPHTSSLKALIIFVWSSMLSFGAIRLSFLVNLYQ